VSLLLAISGWDAAPWRKRFAALLPGHAIVTPETLVDRAAVRAAIVWRHPHGLLAELPELEAIFSLGAGVDHILSDPHLPDVPIARVVDPDLTARMSEWVARCMA
jgi:glyoxylate/hydroxypyruvate reductase A